MTTWASAGYVSRLMEVVALADVVVYVASDERYNDEVPTQFLHLLVRAGKAVVVVLTKMREADAAALADHFRQEVLGRLPKLPDGAVAAGARASPFPHLPAGRAGRPGRGRGAGTASPLLNQVLVQCERRTRPGGGRCANAVRYLAAAGDGLLDVARRDLAELDAWRAVVAAGQGRVRGPLPPGVPVRRAVPPVRPHPRAGHGDARTARRRPGA